MAGESTYSAATMHPVEHSMKRRSTDRDYRSAATAYMLTLAVEERKPLFGALAGTEPEAAVALTPLGEALREAWLSLPDRFPQVCTRDRVDEYVIMPDHFHGIIFIKERMEVHLSRIESYLKGRVHAVYRRLLLEGSAAPVGQAREWLDTYLRQPAEQQAAMRQWVERCIEAYAAGGTEPGRDQAPPFKISQSGSHSKKGFLFEAGYNDAIVWNSGVLENKRSYISANPRVLAIRRERRLFPERAAVDTALSIPALHRYLRMVCPAACVSDEHLAALDQMLLVRPSDATGRIAQAEHIFCDIFGSRSLLERPMLPLVCHRADGHLRGLQRQRCLEAAAAGSVIVSPCISPDEKEIFRAVLEAGHSAVLVLDNGFADRYHPAESSLRLCRDERLLIATPWKYRYVPKSDKIKTAYCKTMNCVAQSLCRTPDSWWKQPLPAK